MKKKALIAVCAMITALCLTGCATDTKFTANNSTDMATDYYGEVSGSANGGAMEDGYVDVELESDSDSAADYSQKLIRTYVYRYQTTAFDQSLKDLNERVAAYGGYTEYMETFDYDMRTAELTIRIPLEQVEGFLSDADKIGEIVYQSVAQKDVTTQYYDTEAHLETLRTQHDRLLELMAQAESLEAIVALESELAEVEYEINSYETTMRVYDNQINYVTIEVTLNEVEQIQVVEKDTFFDRITKNLTRSFRDVGEGLQNFVIFLVSSIPYLMIPAVIAGIVVLIVRVSIHRRRKKREKAVEEAKQQRQD